MFNYVDLTPSSSSVVIRKLFGDLCCDIFYNSIWLSNGPFVDALVSRPVTSSLTHLPTSLSSVVIQLPIVISYHLRELLRSCFYFIPPNLVQFSKSPPRPQGLLMLMFLITQSFKFCSKIFIHFVPKTTCGPPPGIFGILQFWFLTVFFSVLMQARQQKLVVFGS